MDRAKLRNQVYRRHARYNPKRGESAAICPLSNTPLVDNWDLHEVFVRRSGLATKYHDLIMVVENCIPVQHRAHTEWGNSKKAKRLCAIAMLKRIGPRPIGRWYKDLWGKHELSVDKGYLLEPKHMKVRQLVSLVELGAWIQGVSLPETGWNMEGSDGVTDVRAQIALRYQGKRRKWKESLPESHNGYEIGELFDWMDGGYWADYILKTMDIQRPRC